MNRLTCVGLNGIVYSGAPAIDDIEVVIVIACKHLLCQSAKKRASEIVCTRDKKKMQMLVLIFLFLFFLYLLCSFLAFCLLFLLSLHI